VNDFVNDGPTVTTEKLERMKAVILYYVTEEMAELFANAPKVTMHSYGKFIADEIVVRVKQDILGRELERIEAAYPADWWEAFKDHWFPEWAKQRWPVRRVEVRLVARELYPKVALPDKGPVIALDRHETVDGRGEW